VSGYVTFMMGGREMAGRLLEVREVVRAVGVEPLAGSRAPVTGLLILRDLPLPVVDLRQELTLFHIVPLGNRDARQGAGFAGRHLDVLVGSELDVVVRDDKIERLA